MDVALPELLGRVGAGEPDAEGLLVELRGVDAVQQHVAVGAGAVAEAVAVVVALEVLDVLQQQGAAEDVVEGRLVVGVGVEQLHHQEVGVVGDGDGVAAVHQAHLLGVDLPSVLAESLCPGPVDERLVEYAEVFLGGQRVAAHQVALRQSPHHAHVAVVGGEHVGHHRRPLGEGHVAQQPVELVLVDDGQPGRLGAYLLEGAQVVGREVQQVVGQLAALRHHEVVEEEHLVVPSVGGAHDVDHPVVVAEVVLVVDGEVLLQDEVGALERLDVGLPEEQPGRHHCRQQAHQPQPQPPTTDRRGYPETHQPADDAHRRRQPVADAEMTHTQPCHHTQGQCQTGPCVHLQVRQYPVCQPSRQCDAYSQDGCSRIQIVIELRQEVASQQCQAARPLEIAGDILPLT